ncbi:hypothetical protein [Butyrivibrio sp.]|uniref:hypothetical protein n=1 Tax=Butyrivibrio sp. TaxID=28121 RepID=UPI0025BCC20B|nr:hypothetical protein [Butyrivibrio sp.]MBE5836467.1 hypothetical protein [Butyrivibrio sp.]
MGEHEHHEHEHGSEHEHEHHHHEHGGIETKEKAVALLNHMSAHNEAHAEELLKVADKLKDFGNGEASAKVLEAAEFFKKGNELLREACECASKEKE